MCGTSPRDDFKSVVALACRRHQNKRTSTGKGTAAGLEDLTVTNLDRWKELKLKN